MSERSKIYFASDFHLGAPGSLSSPEREKKKLLLGSTISKLMPKKFIWSEMYLISGTNGNMRFLGAMFVFLEN
jgi:hypothetical protein